MSHRVVIVGANLTGGRASEALREHAHAGPIVLAGAEPVRPYERPPLSKDFLRGSVAEETIYLRPAEWYAEQGIELRLGVRATRLHASAKEVELEAGQRLGYDKLLIATGCDARTLDMPGSDLPGIYYLRTVGDSARLAVELGRAQQIVVVGAGFIGSEVAASARVMGRTVTVLEAAPVPLERALGVKMGEVCAAIHRDHGVDLRLGSALREFRGHGRVQEVVLADGNAIRCDLVVVGVGVTPAVAWLDGSGVALDNGVTVNEYLETNVPDVYAAGDVANAWNPLFGERMRLEHFENAQNQGAAAGKIMAGVREAYAAVPFFWSDQYELTLQYVGHARGDDPVTVRGDIARRSFTALYLREDRVRAAFSIGRPREIMAARRLIQSGKQVAPAVLADEQRDLRALAR